MVLEVKCRGCKEKISLRRYQGGGGAGSAREITQADHLHSRVRKMQDVKPSEVLEQSNGVTVLQGEAPTNVEALYHQIGQDLAKKQLPFLNDLLRQLLTMGIGLAGGGLYFLDEKMCHSGMKLAAVGMFFIAILCALAGVLPYRDRFCVSAPYEVKDFVDRAVTWKDCMIWGSSIFLFLGLAAAFVGVLLK
jgi:hypothetical protein